MILGYNTNGFAHHRLDDAIAIIKELGYGGVALTPDVNHYDLTKPIALDSRGLAIVVETGSRFLLDPKRKHRPTLIDPIARERHHRVCFLATCMDVAIDTRSYVEVAIDTHGYVLSFWSGASDTDESHDILMARLVEECKYLSDHAADHYVRIAFEPEPGMFIDTMDKFAELHAKVNHPHFGLTLDVGHIVCLNEGPVSKHIHAWKDWLWNVHLDDMKPGVHDHLMFGEGVVDFDDVFAALKAIDFKGMASVELSRHSYDAVNTAAKSMVFLKRYV